MQVDWGNGEFSGYTGGSAVTPRFSKKYYPRAGQYTIEVEGVYGEPLVDGGDPANYEHVTYATEEVDVAQVTPTLALAARPIP